jgi:hypothetical protein
LPLVAVPEICVLDPDGDVVRHLKRTGAGRVHKGWACYHTQLLAFDLDGVGEVGIVGCAVGAPFAVLVAEQLFASGCRLLVSVTSAGQIAPIGPTPYFVLIERALRDEGTSYHYLPRSTGCWRASRPVFASCPMLRYIGERRGRRMRLTAKPRQPFRVRAIWARAPLKWKLQPFMRLVPPRVIQSSALHMSRTPWPNRRETSKKVRPTVRRRRLLLSPPQRAGGLQQQAEQLKKDDVPRRN